MIFKSKHFALHVGYQLATDLPAGFTLCLLKRRKRGTGGPSYRIILNTAWAWRPYIVWENKHWHLNEAGMVQGLPIYRQRPLRWYQTIRHIGWLTHFSLNWHPND